MGKFVVTQFVGARLQQLAAHRGSFTHQGRAAGMEDELRELKTIVVAGVVGVFATLLAVIAWVVLARRQLGQTVHRLEVRNRAMRGALRLRLRERLRLRCARARAGSGDRAASAARLHAQQGWWLALVDKDQSQILLLEQIEKRLLELHSVAPRPLGVELPDRHAGAVEGGAHVSPGFEAKLDQKISLILRSLYAETPRDSLPSTPRGARRLGSPRSRRGCALCVRAPPTSVRAPGAGRSATLAVRLPCDLTLAVVPGRGGLAPTSLPWLLAGWTSARRQSSSPFQSSVLSRIRPQPRWTGTSRWATTNHPRPLKPMLSRLSSARRPMRT